MADSENGGKQQILGHDPPSVLRQVGQDAVFPQGSGGAASTAGSSSV
jgi:hypothetical protein